MPSLFLPEFEMYVLLAVAQLEDDAYGLSIRKCIESRTGRPVSVGALYTTMARLENKGFLEAHEAESGRGRPGRPRKYCSLTSEGRQALNHSVSMLSRMTEGAALGSLGEVAE